MYELSFKYDAHLRQFHVLESLPTSTVSIIIIIIDTRVCV